ncbi:MAG: ribonuclease III [Acholeplasmatales bacterium]|nr:ribonuclease III [Acholeplasmatales bacterium]
MDAKILNGLTLAYIGDAVYETYIRRHMVEEGITKVKVLHKKVTEYTSGAAQARIVHNLINNAVLTEEEIGIFKRGRNSSVNSCRKNLSLQEYLDATGFEALIGYLHLSLKTERLDELMNLILRKEGELNE